MDGLSLPESGSISDKEIRCKLRCGPSKGLWKIRPIKHGKLDKAGLQSSTIPTSFCGIAYSHVGYV